MCVWNLQCTGTNKEKTSEGRGADVLHVIMWEPQTLLGPTESVLIGEESWIQGATSALGWDGMKCPEYKRYPVFRDHIQGPHSCVQFHTTINNWWPFSPLVPLTLHTSWSSGWTYLATVGSPSLRWSSVLLPLGTGPSAWSANNHYSNHSDGHSHHLHTAEC